MKKFSVIILLVAICFAPTLLRASNEDFSTSQWVPGHLMVNFVPSVGALEDINGKGKPVSMGIPEVDALLAKYNVTVMKRVIDDKILAKLRVIPDFYRFMLLVCPKGTDILAMMKEFDKCPYVDTADPDLLRRVCDRTPNDALWTSQWDKRTMSCPRAWDFSTGSRSIITVAIDGGTFWAHPDFFNNLWVNPGEDLNQNELPYDYTDYPGDTGDIDGIDNDGNGKVDDFLGWDFIDNISGCDTGEDCDAPDNDPYSVGLHGTHVIGLEAAVGNNGIGVAGVNWNIRMMAIRAGYQDNQQNGYCPQSATFPAIPYAVAMGARVLNMSYGGYSGGSQEANILMSAWNNGAILVAAAGNDHVTGIHYPAGHNNVVAVGSTDEGDGMSSFSNYGTWVDVFAPGGGVMSTVIPGYANEQGTSMASPNTAGVFALLWSIFPAYTNAQMVDLVFNHCVDITAQNPTYNPAYLGHGRVDAALPIAAYYPYLTLESTAVFGDADDDGRLETGESGSLSITLHNEANWSVGENISVTLATTEPNISIANGTFSMPTIAPGQSTSSTNTPAQVTVTGAVNDAYNALITANLSNPNGYSYQLSFTIRVGRPQTLVVDDDGVDAFQNYFVSGLYLDNGTFYNHDVWSVQTSGDPVFFDLREYDNIIWVCGNDSVNTLNAANQAALSQYLDAGGRLLLAGQGIDEDPQVNSSTFYANYLHAQSSTASGSRNLVGVPGDPISQDTTLKLLLIGGACGGNGSVGPSVITPINGGIDFFDYRPNTGSGAIRYDNGTYKTAYFAFAIEAACGMNNTVHNKVILDRLMQWFGATTSTIDAENPRTGVVPKNFALKGNYPNPFNPTTTITFDLANNANVKLRVFDVLGREVATLINGSMPAGSHEVMFDGSDYASGVYLVQLQAGNLSDTKRMVLLK